MVRITLFLLKTAALLFILAAACLGTITNVSVTGTTATQAIVTYTAPDANGCTIQVSQNPSLTPLVPDVDPAIFSGANKDLSRASTVTYGLSRTVVIGQRTAQLATASGANTARHYSRALQAAMAHFGLITCPSTGDTASFSFMTTTILLGSTYGEPWFADPSYPGDQPFPESLHDGLGPNGNGSTPWAFVDPKTGLYLQELSTRSDVYANFTGDNPIITAHNAGQVNNSCDTAGPWTNPCSAVCPHGSNCPGAGSNYATVGNSTGWLILPVDFFQYGCSGNTCLNGGLYGGTRYDYGTTLDQVLVSITGYVNSPTTANRVVDVAVSVNGGAVPTTNVQQVTLGQSCCSTLSVGSANQAQPGLSAWLLDSNPRINRQEFQTHVGVVQVTAQSGGYDTLSWQNGGSSGCNPGSSGISCNDPFSTYWFSPQGNGTIWLSPTSVANACEFNLSTHMPAADAVEYALSSMTDGNDIVVSDPGATLKSGGTYYYCEHNTVVMIRRDSADNNTLYLQKIYLWAITHSMLGIPTTGDFTAFYNTPVNGGYFGVFGGLFWVNPSTVPAQTAWLGQPLLGVKPSSSGSESWGYQGACPGVMGTWDQTQSVPTWYCTAIDNNNKPIIVRGQYYGPTTAPAQAQQSGNQMANYPQQSVTDDYSIYYGTTCPSGPNNACLVYTDITPSSASHSVWDLVTALNPSFSSTTYSHCGASGMVVQQGNLFLDCRSQSQDTPAWEIIISPGDGVPADAGGAGAHAISAHPTNSALIRWRGEHALDDHGESPYFSYQTNGYGTMIVTTNTSITAAGSSCPAGWTGNGQPCVNVTINSYNKGGSCTASYEPYLQSPSVPFQGCGGELGASQAGLGLMAGVGDTISFSSPSGELMTLVQKNAGGAWVFQHSTSPQSYNCASGCTLFFQASSTTREFWNGTTDPNGLTPLQDPGSGDHQYIRDGGSLASYNTGSLGCGNTLFTSYQARTGNLPSILGNPINTVTAAPIFDGSCWGLALTNDVQQHPSPAGALASGYEAQQGFDVLPQLGGSQTIGGQGGGTWINVTGQLYTYTPTLPVTDPDDINIPACCGMTGTINRKLTGTALSCGAHPLLDVSAPSPAMGGPASVIDGTTANPYKFCIARAAGECPGSDHSAATQAGQMWVNCPDVISPGVQDNTGYFSTLSCVTASGGCMMGMGNDILVYNASAHSNVAAQFSLWKSDAAGALSHNLTIAVGRIRLTYGFDTMRLLPDNSWAVFRGDYLNLNGEDMWIGKMLPWPASDSDNRHTYIPISVTLQPPSSDLNIAKAIVEFGYGENGAPANLYCTTRADVCVANQATVPSGNAPFQFASESPVGLSCVSQCTISIPAIPDRILYYRAEYLDSSNNVLSTSATQAIAVDNPHSVTGL
jgi:hypothetical protein